DNGSSDRTSETVLRYTARQTHWRLVREEKPGAGAARNRGVRESCGEIILFVDDDVIPDAQLIEEHRKSHRQHRAVAVLGHVRFPWRGNESAYHWLLTHRPELLQSFRFRDPLDVPFLHFYTCNASVPRSLLLRGDLFDETFSGAAFEDTDLGYRLTRSGCRIIFNPRASALHDFQLSPPLFAEKRRRAGHGLHRLLKKHPELRPTLEETRHPVRRRVRSVMGALLAPAADCLDRCGRLAPAFLLPLLGRLLWYVFEYQFWSGFREGDRSHLPLGNPGVAKPPCEEGN
ncbi:MAG: glycosyltransferase family 2 protein, partial [Dehalococcoidia bacterium]